MTKLAWWKRSLMVLGATASAVAALAIGPRQGRSAESHGIEQAPDGAPFQYYGSASCKGCHNISAANQTGFPKAIGFIQLTEWATWNEEDKHSVAYKRLTGDRGRRMASLLKIDVNKPEAGCLGCHSASIEEIKNRFPQGSEFNPSEGVSCENCHGPYSEWSAKHLDPSFRTLGTEKWAKLGFTELRTPADQAEKCLSCHIGKSSEGKVVTHEMYAAGHPPLPSIEVATFTNLMPRHWWLLSERTNADLRKSLGFQEGQLEQTKLAIVGAAVALKTSMKLLADEARLDEKGPAPGQEWPDYARFDCWSCHHDLKRDGWRQARGFDGPPGRVPVNEWPLALVELGIDRLILIDPAAASLRSDLQRLEKTIREQASARPFGRKDPMAKAAAELAEWSEVLIQKLNAAPFDREIAAKLLRKLVEQAQSSTPDYDSARHIAWTIKLMVTELGETLPDRKPIEAIIARLNEGLKLDLPAGRKYEIEDQIGPALQVIGDYEPAAFQRQLKELLGLLPPG